MQLVKPYIKGFTVQGVKANTIVGVKANTAVFKALQLKSLRWGNKPFISQ